MNNDIKLPLCECGCGKHVRQARFKFFSPECSQKAARLSGGKRKVPENSMDVDGDTCKVARLTPTEVRTLEEIIVVCDIDTDTWEIERYSVNSWDGPTSDGIEKLYQVKATLKRKALIVAVRAEIEALKEEAKACVGARKRLSRVRKPSGLLLEIALPDLHFGKLSWGRETGHEDYDTKIAARLFNEALESLIHRTSHYKFDKVLFVLGNDLCHIDGRNATTTAGTPQDVDTRYYKLFGDIRRMCVAAIDRCRLVAPVHVVVCPGNHDSQTAYCIGDSLECWFHNTDDVTIDNEPTPRKYVRHGDVLLMIAHGDKGKLSDYPMLMAAERPDLFGQTKYREAHTGHRHQVRTEEQHGIRVRISPALCAADAWHSDNGYVGNLRSAEAYVWSATEGLVATAHFNVPDSRILND